MLRLTVVLALLAGPAMAAEGAFVSLSNTNFVVLLAFLCFLGVLLYFGVPGHLTSMLDKRAERIKAELDEARSLREEARALLASYERKSREVQEQADRIVSTAKAEAEAAAEQAKEDLKHSIARRLASAEDQIKSAEAAAVREVKDRAVQVAVAAASTVIAREMDASSANKLIDEAIASVEAKLH